MCVCAVGGVPVRVQHLLGLRRHVFVDVLYSWMYCIHGCTPLRVYRCSAFMDLCTGLVGGTRDDMYAFMNVLPPMSRYIYVLPLWIYVPGSSEGGIKGRERRG